jgi:hypothetical protein
MPRRWKRILIVGGAAAVVLAGLWLQKSTEVTAVITVVYVILVYFQLQVMQDQYQAGLAERRQLAEREEAQKPKLEFPDLCVRRTIEIDNSRGVELGPAWYVNSTIRNVGGSIAKTVQPVLTATAERLPDRRWRRHTDWIPLGLRWCLDEINAVRGAPTQDRYLVPNRPYLFDLGKVSTYLPEPKFEITTLVKPTAQQNDFATGEYCFEVTAYSENAPPTRSWYIVVIHDLRSPNPITVEQVPTAPWADATSRTAGNA